MLNPLSGFYVYKDLRVGNLKMFNNKGDFSGKRKECKAAPSERKNVHSNITTIHKLYRQVIPITNVNVYIKRTLTHV